MKDTDRLVALRSFEGEQSTLAAREANVKIRLARLQRIRPLAPDWTVVDVGSGRGGYVIALARQGYRVCGVEPLAKSRAIAARLAEHEGVSTTFLEGVAEKLPLETESIDLIHCNSVIEHVDDAQAAFNEAYRVLKPGGIYWFNAASSLCPRQNEIRRFPLFGWYPDPLKQRIMAWARDSKPHLVAYASKPAVQWFTPAKAHRMLHKAGFEQIIDRWDLRLLSEGGALYRVLLRIIRMSKVTKLLADLCISGCAYAAIKPDGQDKT